MENMQVCPMCGATNVTTNTRCVRCAHFLFPSTPSGEKPGPVQQQERRFFSGLDLQSEQTRPRSRIVRSSSRRKFLVGLLGSGAILALGSVGLAQMAQNVQVALNTKQYTGNFWDGLVGESYSPDLNFMAMVKVGEEDSPQAKLYIWDYQQQQMTTLPTGPDYGNPVWSPDNHSLLFQAHLPGDQTALELWDVQNQRKLRSYASDDYPGFSKIQWSPDGSQIALLLDKFVLLSPTHLTPISSFNRPDATDFIWSPDSRKVAFVSGNPSDTTWGIQIWDVQAQAKEAEITFQGQSTQSLPGLVWSPDGAQIAAIGDGQLRMIEVGQQLTSYSLDLPNDGGLLAWSPDSRYLAAAVWSPNGLLSFSSSRFGVWDTVERKQVRSLNSGTFPSSVPHALIWSKDGKSIRIIADLYQQENWSWP
jgi:WD40 repeat protein